MSLQDDDVLRGVRRARKAEEIGLRYGNNIARNSRFLNAPTQTQALATRFSRDEYMGKQSNPLLRTATRVLEGGGNYETASTASKGNSGG